MTSVSFFFFILFLSTSFLCSLFLFCHTFSLTPLAFPRSFIHASPKPFSPEFLLHSLANLLYPQFLSHILPCFLFPFTYSTFSILLSFQVHTFFFTSRHAKLRFSASPKTRENSRFPRNKVNNPK